MDVAQASELHRAELLAHCYRMLGSMHDAEDLVQETMLRAWRSRDAYDESRGAVRTWLYKIATNACLSYLDARGRRALPADLSGPSALIPVEKLAASPEILWLEPFPSGFAGDPAVVVEARETIRLAFVAALQHLPPRQRAVLILRDVLAMPAADVASLLETSVASVNSALQRARAQLAEASPSADGAGLAEPSEEELKDLLDRYSTAFENFDVEALKQTLREDALLQMPPFPAWFQGREMIGAFLATAFARGGSFRTAQTHANAQPAMALYRRRESTEYRFLNIQVLTPTVDGIARIDAFHDETLCASLGIPVVLNQQRPTAR